MPHKAKYPVEKLIEIVEECLRGEISQNGATKKYGVSRDTIVTWIRQYKQHGAEGLMPQTKIARYADEVKYKAVEEYLSGKSSLNDICNRYGIRNQYRVRQWIKWYNSHGDFNRPNVGGEVYMKKGRKVTLEEKITIVSECIAQNKDYGKIIGQYGVSYQQIYNWVRKYEAQGIEGLRDRRGKRKPPSEMSETEQLQAQIKLKDAENRRLQMENDLLKKLSELERRWGGD